MSERRVLITEDKDFGDLVYVHGRSTTGVILLRFPAGVRTQLPQVIIDIVDEWGEYLYGRFVVVQPGRTRVSPQLED